MKKDYNFIPIGFPLFIAFLVFLFLLLPILVFLYTGGIVAAFARLGFSPATGFLLFLFTLIGSAINIPIKRLKSRAPLIQERVVNFFRGSYRVLVVISEDILVALIPIIISLYEFIRMLVSGHFIQILITIISVIIVSVFCHMFAKPVKGVGIAIPFFLPPFITVLVAFLLARGNAAAVAYISGTLGTLIGADISNLDKLDELGAPVASIGGAGTFDGIFLTGILSVLLI